MSASEATVPNDLTSVLEQCLRVLESRPAGLLTDIDGTISLIAPTPDAASVDGGARAALASLAATLDVIGAVTGRAAENAEQMVAVPGMIYIGNHGLERRLGGLTHVHPEAMFAVGAIAEALHAVRAAAGMAGITEGVLFENKGVTGSVHYRLAPDQDAARAALLPLIQAAADARGLKVSEGRMVLELRPRVAVNKGSAVRDVVAEYGLRSLIFLGDDTTDIDGFAALAALRSVGGLNGLNIAVVAPESPPDVAAAADVVVHGVAACVTLLGGLAEALSAVESHLEES